MENKDKKQTSYLLCTNCNAVTFDEVWKLTLEGIPAPCCGTGADLRIVWPRNYIQKTIAAVQEQDLNTQESVSFAIFGLSEILETLIEECLARWLDLRQTDEVSKKLILDGAPGLVNCITIFDKISDTPLEALLKKSNFDGILNDWHTLADNRDRLVRNSFFKTSKNEQEFLKKIRSSYLEAFIAINNDIARQVKITKKDTYAKKRKIFLVVDDEKETLGYLSKIIKRQGHDAAAVENGAKAIESYNREKPDCVFLDVILPDTDGMSVLKQMVELDPKANIYFVTGIDGAAFQKEAIEHGAKGVLSKPINLNEVLRIIDNT